MVWYNSKDPGIRLGDDTSLGLSISCTKCNHTARIRLDVALRLWGERTHARDIARDLRCSRGKARAASVQVIPDVRPPWQVHEDPGGGFSFRPSYPIVRPPPAGATMSARRRGWTAIADETSANING